MTRWPAKNSLFRIVFKYLETLGNVIRFGIES